MEPALVLSTDQLREVREDIKKALQEGKARSVIKKYDPDQATLPKDPLLSLALVGAYVQEGENMERATSLAEHAMAAHKDCPEEYATACAQRARIAYRLDGYESSLEWLAKAVEAYPKCLVARYNALCYASLEKDIEGLDEQVREFVDTFPNFAVDDALCSYFIEDAQLAWARRQPVFRQKILENISNDNNGQTKKE
jgi:tetratricopeptide (TPR) repeat protein